MGAGRDAQARPETARAPIRALPARVPGPLPRGVDGGPLLLVSVGLHGNEPDGLFALERVLARLDRERPPFAGRLAAFVGNRAALLAGRRFVDEDMNRVWKPDAIRALRAAPAAGDNSEQRELRELLDLVERELDRPNERVLHLDLHSTSGGGPPFTVIARPGPSRDAGRELGVPLILGLEELVAGTFIEWSSARGHAALVVEGGMCDAPATVDRHESALWVALAQAGVIERRHVPEFAFHRERLDAAVRGLPPELEVAYRHHVEPGTDFRMIAGLGNLQAVERGALLAHEGPGLASEVRAPWSGTLLMPRYQGQGVDGFFLGRPPAARARADDSPRSG